MGNKLRMGNRLFVIMDRKVFIRRSKIERERQSSREELKYDEKIRVKHQNENASYFSRHKKNPLIQKNVDWSSKFICRLSQKAYSATREENRKKSLLSSIQALLCSSAASMKQGARAGATACSWNPRPYYVNKNITKGNLLLLNPFFYAAVSSSTPDIGGS